MRRTAQVLIAALLVALVSVTGATAAGGSFKASLKFGKAKVNNGTVDQRGTFTSSFGSGKVRLLSKGANQRFQSTVTLTLAKGTLKMKGKTSTGGAADPGKYSIRGTWTVAGGTGSYKHAKGSVSVLGLGTNDLSSSKISVKGHVST
jgi:hypothetical protein